MARLIKTRNATNPKTGKSNSYENAVTMLTKEIETRLRQLDAAMNAEG